MIPPIPTLQEYGLSPNFGFLPNVDPVARISSPYYEPWEKVVDDLPGLIRTKAVRGVIGALPMLSLYHLVGEAEMRRAYVVLGFLTHSYVWAGDEPAEILPASISAPLLELSDYFEIPPVATYATVCLWNYHSVNPHQRKDLLSNLRTITTFTGTHDEAWFYLISVAIEARGAASIPIMLRAIAAAREGDADTVIRALAMFADHITDLGELLDRMDEGCHPNVFYFQIRPFLAGSKNMEESGLPRGVMYEDRNGNRSWQKYSGGSNAQSSLIQTFDIILGVEHRQTGEKKSPGSEQLQGTAPPAQNNFIQNMRFYMPGSHRRFLEHLTTVANIKDFANAHRDNHALTAAYDNALHALARFRSVHVQMVTRYIILPSSAEKKRVASLSGGKRLPQGMALDEPRQGLAKDEASRKGLRGTGGTQLIPFLKQARDETTEPAIGGSTPLSVSSAVSGKRPARVARVPTDFAKSCNVNEFEDLNPGFVGLAGAWSAADDAGGLCHS